MSAFTADRFPEFFKAVYRHEPFPWQAMLAHRVAEHGWPEALQLPTASGKTACLDIAVFTLALQSERPLLERTSRLRMFFVVDRRIVVDEAYERACRLVIELAEAKQGIVREVADRLRRFTADGPPLCAARLRGGTIRDQTWRQDAAQPVIVTGTVDQVGSRMLFRGYGVTRSTAPIDAALTVCDSLVLLDEAHCAVPFMQSATAIRGYASEPWSRPVAPPLAFSILSATPPIAAGTCFPSPAERHAALDHAVLRTRMDASKPARLIDVTSSREGSPDPLVRQAADEVMAMIVVGHTRVAVMVNRVATAGAIHELLSRALEAESADVVLITGRMRPIDRDHVVTHWKSMLRAGSDERPERPIVVVTTQCLEVGADFSFSALVTECASLDALRQRFGRVNRFGLPEPVDAAILVRRDQLTTGADDPIYGTSLSETWSWLQEHSSVSGKGRTRTRVVDFGIAALEALLPEDASERGALVARLSAPAPDAPVLLPAHLDLLVQTAPVPNPDPDTAIFLHGAGRHQPEAFLVFRSDLAGSASSSWPEILSLVPPTMAEALAVPLGRLRRWLAGVRTAESGGDVEGERSDDDASPEQSPTEYIVWHGRDSEPSGRIRPNQIVVVPADESRAALLGGSFQRPADVPLDSAERAYPVARGQTLLRVLPLPPEPWHRSEPGRQLIEWAQVQDRESDELRPLLASLAAYQPESDSDDAGPPPWVREAALRLSKDRPRVLSHPLGGVVLLGSIRAATAALEGEFADEDDTASAARAPVPLTVHARDVGTRAAERAARCVVRSMIDPLRTAGLRHDGGKLDERFQAWIAGGILAAAALAQPLAKSDDIPRSRAVRDRIRAGAGLPAGFRHEMLSARLAEAAEDLQDDPELRELVVHLIEAHHGFARPFAPPCTDPEPPDVSGEIYSGVAASVSAEARLTAAPAHRIDSGVADRFWSTVHRYGWWGAAYLEAILRLADWHASEVAASAGESEEDAA